MRSEAAALVRASTNWRRRSPVLVIGLAPIAFLGLSFGIAPVIGLPPAEPAIFAASSRVPAQGELLREFTDPCLGTHWQLRADPVHPEGPRRLILLDPLGTRRRGPGDRRAGDQALSSRLRSAATGQESVESGNEAPNLAPPLAIRAGDHVTVDQQTPLLHARLQAVALESAGVGQQMRVRLGAGAISQLSQSATVIAVLVTGPGQAKW
jgi:hypothetical protein